MTKEQVLSTLDLDEDLKAELAAIRPEGDYLLVAYIADRGGIVKSDDIRDSKQKGIVIDVGPGEWRERHFITNSTKVGDVIMWEEAAEANTPTNLKSREVYLIKEARKIATIINTSGFEAKETTK